jgi:NAD(P)-dependent dehydrogenase (short-subunit alcohol dehydrogenase family)
MQQQRSILITGCSSGIGYTCAHGLKMRGWQVIASARQVEDVERLRSEGLSAVQLDLSDSDSLASGLEAALSLTNGRLDALFNNGAYGQPGAVEDLTTETLRAQFETNLFGWHELTRRLIPLMRAQGHGRIVQNSSVLGLVALPFRGAYVASKFALEGWADCLRLECRDLPIHVSLIQPGPIATRFNVNALDQYRHWIDAGASTRAAELRSIEGRYTEDRTPSRFELPPAAVAAKVVHALEARRPRARYRVTTPTFIAEIIRRLAPGGVRDWIMARN